MSPCIQYTDVAQELDHLYVQLSSLSIQAFNLYKSPTAQDPTSLYDLCTASCQVLETFDRLDKSEHISLPASGIYFYHGIMVPCHILLRLLKTSFARYIDVERAKTSLFLGIRLNKRLSLQNDDIPARNAVALTQMWTSNRVFRRPNGTEAVALRVRSRLLASMILDGIVWWREESGAFMGVYPPPISRNGTNPQLIKHIGASQLTITEDAHGNDNGPAASANGQMDPAMPILTKPENTNFLDDPMLAELGWPVGEDIFSSLWADDTLGAAG